MKEELIEKVIKSRRRMNRFIREGSVESWINLNLTIPQMKCLTYISRHGKTNLSGLAAGIHVTPANVTGIIDRLVDQGYVARIPDSALSNLREGRSGKMRELLECLSDNELSIVSQAFDILAGAVSKVKESDDKND
jgi:DNA-binding MarR family transcriptional regulator